MAATIRLVCRIGVSTLLLGATGAAADPASVDTANLARDLDLQTAMPADIRLQGGFLTFDLFTVLLWSAVILGTVAVLWSLRDSLPVDLFSSRLRSWRAQDENDETTADASRREAARVAADDLAGQGRFAEAMHVLLLEALGEMRRRRDDLAFADSLTSREIVRRAPVSEAAKAALGGLIGLVERTWFGEQAADAADYGEARARYLALGAALAARPA